MINQNFPVPSFLDLEISVGVLHYYCEGLTVQTETGLLLDRSEQQIRAHRLSMPKTIPKIDGYFGKNPKPK